MELARGALFSGWQPWEAQNEGKSAFDTVCRARQEGWWYLTPRGTTDACIRKNGVDPATGQRYIEELAFEVVNDQSERDLRDKAEEMTKWGVRRIFAIFVKKRTVYAWSATNRTWKPLDRKDVIHDTSLAHPVHVQALLDVVAADNAVVLALEAKDNPAIQKMKIAAREQADRARERPRARGRNSPGATACWTPAKRTPRARKKPASASKPTEHVNKPTATANKPTEHAKTKHDGVRPPRPNWHNYVP